MTVVQLSLPPRAALADTSTNLFADPVVATGKGFEIKRSQLDDAFLDYSASEAAKGNTIPDTDRAACPLKIAGSLDHRSNPAANGHADEKAKMHKMVDDAIHDRAHQLRPTPLKPRSRPAA